MTQRFLNVSSSGLECEIYSCNEVPAHRYTLLRPLRSLPTIVYLSSSMVALLKSRAGQCGLRLVKMLFECIFIWESISTILHAICTSLIPKLIKNTSVFLFCISVRLRSRGILAPTVCWASHTHSQVRSSLFCYLWQLLSSTPKLSCG